MTLVTAAKKSKLIRKLQDAQDRIYDVDQVIGRFRITKETAEMWSIAAKNLQEADKLISAVLESWE